MSLRKSPTMTPARLAANRLNALNSTGPRTARGKAQSRMNALRSGVSSLFMLNLVNTLLAAPPCAFEQTVAAVLTPQQARNPVIADAVEVFRQGNWLSSRDFRGSSEREERRRTTSF
jgi:hypothetical protein